MFCFFGVPLCSRSLRFTRGMTLIQPCIAESAKSLRWRFRQAILLFVAYIVSPICTDRHLARHESMFQRLRYCIIMYFNSSLEALVDKYGSRTGGRT